MLLLFLVPGLLFQQPASSIPGASAAEVESLFQRAAAAQFTPGSSPAEVHGFRMDLNLRERGEHPREIAFELAYRDASGGMIRIRVDDPERGALVEGFDGRRYWLREDDGTLRFLQGHEFTRDREKIDQALDLCKDLVILLDLDQLHKRSRDFRLLPEDDTGPGIAGTLDRAGRPWRFALRLHRDSLLPASLRVESLPEKPVDGGTGPPAPVVQRFLLRAPRTYEGRRIPQLIEMYQDEEELPIRLLEIHQIFWRTPPPGAEFEPG